jgi:hypothetical protein
MEEKRIISPTIGRKVWYWPSDHDRHIGLTYVPYHNAIQAHDLTQPCDATVVYVHGDRMVNLQIIDHNGNAHIRTSVPLVQPDDEKSAQRGYAEWMPFQVGQAKAST